MSMCHFSVKVVHCPQCNKKVVPRSLKAANKTKDRLNYRVGLDHNVQSINSSLVCYKGSNE